MSFIIYNVEETPLSILLKATETFTTNPLDDFILFLPDKEKIIEKFKAFKIGEIYSSFQKKKNIVKAEIIDYDDGIVNGPHYVSKEMDISKMTKFMERKYDKLVIFYDDYTSYERLENYTVFGFIPNIEALNIETVIDMIKKNKRELQYMQLAPIIHKNVLYAYERVYVLYPCEGGVIVSSEPMINIKADEIKNFYVGEGVIYDFNTNKIKILKPQDETEIVREMMRKLEDKERVDGDCEICKAKNRKATVNIRLARRYVDRHCAKCIWDNRHKLLTDEKLETLKVDEYFDEFLMGEW